MLKHTGIRELPIKAIQRAMLEKGYWLRLESKNTDFHEQFEFVLYISKTGKRDGLPPAQKHWHGLDFLTEKEANMKPAADWVEPKDDWAADGDDGDDGRDEGPAPAASASASASAAAPAQTASSGPAFKVAVLPTPAAEDD